MRNAVRSCLVVLVLFASNSITQASAQAPAASPDAAWQRYNDEKQSPLLVGGLELVVPFVGYAVAGDVKQGLLPNGVRLVGLVISMSGAASYPPNQGQAMIGQLIYLGGAAWATYDAYGLAKSNNTALRQKHGLSIAPSISREGVSMLAVVNIPIGGGGR